MEGVEGLPTDEQMVEILSHVAASPRFVSRCAQALAFCRTCCDGITQVVVVSPGERLTIHLHVCDDDECETKALRVHQGNPGDPQAWC